VSVSSTKQGASPSSRESKLRALLKKAEIDAYALAHSYDIGGDFDHAWKLVSIGEYLREAASQLNEVAVHILDPQNVTPAWGLKRSRVHGPCVGKFKGGSFGGPSGRIREARALTSSAQRSAVSCDLNRVSPTSCCRRIWLALWSFW
jgi:hypothetical protein